MFMLFNCRFRAPKMLILWPLLWKYIHCGTKYETSLFLKTFFKIKYYLGTCIDWVSGNVLWYNRCIVHILRYYNIILQKQHVQVSPYFLIAIWIILILAAVKEGAFISDSCRSFLALHCALLTFHSYLCIYADIYTRLLWLQSLSTAARYILL